MAQFKLRAMQLDLARQMESPAFIRFIIDFLADSGYNALMLYLEDRIKTKSYPYPADNECYTPKEIRELVAYGASRGIELFPCIPTIGHAERFLRFPEMEPIAETRYGIKGRFGGNGKSSFCVSTPATYQFLFKYMTEVAELFPSKYFHIGLDEFWDFGLCDLCKKAAPDFKSEEQLFLKHVLKVEKFLREKLGKRAMMWSDMFELYHDVLEKVPRNVIMAEWQYQTDVRFLQAHFNNLTQTHLDHFEKLGFEVVICPADRSLSNGESFIQYAKQYKCVLGGLQTNWEKTDTYLYRSLPLFGSWGRQLKGMDAEEALPDTLKSIFGEKLGTDDTFIWAVRSLMDNGGGFLRHYESSAKNILFSRSTFGFPSADFAAGNLTLETLGNAWKKACSLKLPTWKRWIIQDMWDGAYENLLMLELNKAATEILDFGVTTKRKKKLRQIQKEYEKFYRIREDWWKETRPGITPNFHTVKLPQIFKRLDSFCKTLENSQQLYLRIRIAHCDWYGMPQLTLHVKNAKRQWKELGTWNLKPSNIEHTQEAEYFLPIDEPELAKATALRIEHNGYGGAGVAYVALVQNGKILKRPAQILSQHDLVYGAEYLLTDDSRFMMLGSQDMQLNYEHKELFFQSHGIELKLK